METPRNESRRDGGRNDLNLASYHHHRLLYIPSSIFGAQFKLGSSEGAFYTQFRGCLELALVGE